MLFLITLVCTSLLSSVTGDQEFNDINIADYSGNQDLNDKNAEDYFVAYAKSDAAPCPHRRSYNDDSYRIIPGTPKIDSANKKESEAPTTTEAIVVKEPSTLPPPKSYAAVVPTSEIKIADENTPTRKEYIDLDEYTRQLLNLLSNPKPDENQSAPTVYKAEPEIQFLPPKAPEPLCNTNKESEENKESSGRRNFAADPRFHNIQKTLDLQNGQVKSLAWANEAANENLLLDPTRGAGIVPMSSGKLRTLGNTIICYACSTKNDPTCWKPTRQATTKYCRAGRDACVTRTYNHTVDASLVVIRDCGNVCNTIDIGDMKQLSCSICRDDLCNSDEFDPKPNSSSINHFSIILICMVTGFFKYVS